MILENFDNKRDLTTGIKRLTILADYLTKIDRDHFDLRSWADHKNVQEIDWPITERKVVKQIQEGVCGTTACAVGHATMIPEFRKAGLKLSVMDVFKGEDDITSTVVFHPPGSIYSYDGTEAAAMFFKITEDEACDLFMPSAYGNGNPGKREVVARIRAQIKEMQKQLSIKKIARKKR